MELDDLPFEVRRHRDRIDRFLMSNRIEGIFRARTCSGVGTRIAVCFSVPSFSALTAHPRVPLTSRKSPTGVYVQEIAACVRFVSDSVAQCALIRVQVFCSSEVTTGWHTRRFPPISLPPTRWPAFKFLPTPSLLSLTSLVLVLPAISLPSPPSTSRQPPPSPAAFPSTASNDSAADLRVNPHHLNVVTPRTRSPCHCHVRCHCRCLAAAQPARWPPSAGRCSCRRRIRLKHQPAESSSYRTPGCHPHCHHQVAPVAALLMAHRHSHSHSHSHSHHRSCSRNRGEAAEAVLLLRATCGDWR